MVQYLHLRVLNISMAYNKLSYPSPDLKARHTRRDVRGVRELGARAIFKLQIQWIYAVYIEHKCNICKQIFIYIYIFI